VCGWLEQLRERYNERYVRSLRDEGRNDNDNVDDNDNDNDDVDDNDNDNVDDNLGIRNQKPETSAFSHQPSDDEGIVVNSGYRSEAVNRAVGGSATSNHLTGCAADIRVAGMEQLLRYAVILLDISDETGEEFDELLLERNARGTYWLHFAVRPSGNRRKVKLIKAS
jgi:U3 small nucleolar RNA-associated protein 14